MVRDRPGLCGSLRTVVRRVLVIGCVLPVLATAQADAQPAGAAAAPAAGDSVRPRVKVSDRSTLETVATIPTAVVLLPFEILFGATSMTLNFVQTNRAIDRVVDLLQSEDTHRSLLPTYSGRGGVGLVYTHRGLFSPQSRLDIKAMGFFDSRQTFEARLRRVRFADGQFGTAALARYQFLPTEPFFGLGQDSREEDKREYEFERTTLQLDADTDLMRSVQATAGVQWTKSNVRATHGAPAGDPAGEPTGTLERPQVLRVQALLSWEGHDRAHQSQAILGAALAHELTSGDFGWSEWHAAYTQYISLGLGRTLALGAATTVLEPGSGLTIPFYDLVTLGGQETLRGYDRDRFRDQGMVRANAEYRFPMHPNLLDGALFVDTGRMFSDLFDENPVRRVHVGYGVGFRLWNARGVFATADLAYSREGWHAYVSLN